MWVKGGDLGGTLDTAYTSLPLAVHSPSRGCLYILYASPWNTLNFPITQFAPFNQNVFPHSRATYTNLSQCSSPNWTFSPTKVSLTFLVGMNFPSLLLSYFLCPSFMVLNYNLLYFLSESPQWVVSSLRVGNDHFMFLFYIFQDIRTDPATVGDKIIFIKLTWERCPSKSSRPLC